MMPPGQALDLAFDSPVGPIFGRGVVITSSRWTLEIESLDLPYLPPADTAITVFARAHAYTAFVQRCDRRTFEILRPHDLEYKPTT